MGDIGLKRGNSLSHKGGIPEEITLEQRGDTDEETAFFRFKPIGGGPVVIGAVGGRRGRPAKLIISGTLERRDP